MTNPARQRPDRHLLASARAVRDTRWAVFLLPWLAGCQPVDERLVQDLEWTWAFLSFASVLLAGGGLIWWRYGKRLRDWDLESSPAAPDSSRARNILISAIVVCVLTFALYNLFADIGIPPDQQWQNILGLFIGSAVGFAAAYWGGRRLASTSYRKQHGGEDR